MTTGGPVRPDPWGALRAATAARIALGRSGVSLPTSQWLAFGVAQAQARDAVQAALDAGVLREALRLDGAQEVLEAASAAPDRAAYLRRPDLGRRLSDASRGSLAAAPMRACDVLVVVADGLSATAAMRQAVPLWRALRPRLEAARLSIGPLVLAHQARVALGDELGELLGARLVVMLLGERPGLSAPDSLGAYVTAAPRVGRTDAERNCVSNIRPEGLSFDAAAHTIAWLCQAGVRQGVTGVALKDESGGVARLP